MRGTLALLGLVRLSFMMGASAQTSEAKPIQVMIVGTFHMSNPSHDLHNVHVDDVLTPANQKRLQSIAGELGRFQPTKVAVEWPKDVVEERYPKFLAGTLPSSRNEVVQLGFRLAQESKAQGVYGIDADGEFPYQQLTTFAKAHGDMRILDELNKQGDVFNFQLQDILDHKGIISALSLINDPKRLTHDNDFYRSVLRIGAENEQPGVTLVSDWYQRNLRICANLLQ